MNENINFGETPENIPTPPNDETNNNLTNEVFDSTNIQETNAEEPCCNDLSCTEITASDLTENTPLDNEDLANTETEVTTQSVATEPSVPQQNFYNPSAPQPNGYYCAPQPPQAPPYQPLYQPPYQPQNAPYQAPQGTPQYNPQYPYNPQNPVYTAPQPAPKKAGTGTKVMLICLWVLLGLFGTAIIGVCGYYIGNKGLSMPDVDYGEFFGGDFTYPTIPYDDYDYDDPDDNIIVPSQNDDLYNSDTTIVLKDYPSDQDNTSKYNTKSAFEKVSPSTVGIVCYSDKDKNNLLGQGTGIIVDKNGYIATNSHVIGDTKSSYVSVVLDNGTTYSAEVVGYDTRTDLAVIKISASGLTPAEFADSDQISIGEDVIAVGNPGGIEFQNTLTRGVISAKDRTLGLSTQVSYIQTDAAINPGNSGGPLCNIYGQVIGINSAKIADADYEGMGFAIPSTTVKEVVDDLIKQGYVEGRVKIGITGNISTSSFLSGDVPTGIQIAEIIENGPCDNGEIKVGDIICKLDDYEIKSFNDIYVALTKYKAGDKATLTIYSVETGEYYESEVILQTDNGSTTAE